MAGSEDGLRGGGRRGLGALADREMPDWAEDPGAGAVRGPGATRMGEREEGIGNIPQIS